MVVQVEITFETMMAERFVKWKADSGVKATPAAKPPTKSKAKAPPATNSTHKATASSPPPPDKAKPAKASKRGISIAAAQQQEPHNDTDGVDNDDDSLRAGGGTSKKKRGAPQNTIQRFLQSKALVKFPPMTTHGCVMDAGSRSTDPSNTVQHPLQELSRAEKSRQAMVVDKLTYMGFSRADALLSCEKCGSDHIDTNMIWLVSMVEERRFQDELNKAQIESELQKRDEDTQHKRKELQVLETTSSLRALFPESVAFDPESHAPLVIDLIDKFLLNMDDPATSPLRQAVADILTHETKARRWYPRPSKCYVADLVQRVNGTLATHPPTAACCGQRTPSKRECPLLTLVQAELATLKAHLYMSTSNVGGVPQAFLDADDANRFSLAADGFEVCNVQDLVSDDDD
ncbi:hypothetical protein DYB30_003050 [Aphanomyces astaci]|uniref:UBA domain-containing protein n=1 Tax=Aphanomyces astaci TaxID=112090 RepID=A0A397DXW6_APHAT|nr:hypothetical protein DYB30_003050 [Aphanomyces astaci]